MKTWKCLTLASLCVALAGPASAHTIATFALDGVTFDNGGTASGGFDYDVNTGTVSNVNIPTTLNFNLGTRAPPGFTFTWSAAFATSIGDSLSASSATNPSQFLIAMVHHAPEGAEILSFILADSSGQVLNQPLSTSNVVKGASFPLYVITNNASFASSTDTGVVNYMTGGSLDVTALSTVPEPSTWAMMILGFGGLGIAMRSRRRQAAAAA